MRSKWLLLPIVSLSFIATANADTPIPITTCTQLNNLQPSGHYVLSRNLSGCTITGNAQPFQGTLEGQDIETKTGLAFAPVISGDFEHPLFASLQGATIENIQFKDTNPMMHGAVIADAVGSGTHIDDIDVSTKNAMVFGVIDGSPSPVQISNIYATGAITLNGGETDTKDIGFLAQDMTGVVLTNATLSNVKIGIQDKSAIQDAGVVVGDMSQYTRLQNVVVNGSSFVVSNSDVVNFGGVAGMMDGKTDSLNDVSESNDKYTIYLSGKVPSSAGFVLGVHQSGHVSSVYVRGGQNDLFNVGVNGHLSSKPACVGGGIGASFSPGQLDEFSLPYLGTLGVAVSAPPLLPDTGAYFGYFLGCNLDVSDKTSIQASKHIMFPKIGYQPFLGLTGIEKAGLVVGYHAVDDQRKIPSGTIANIDGSSCIQQSDVTAIKMLPQYGYNPSRKTAARLSSSAMPCLAPMNVAIGAYHACVALATGSIKCWGDNKEGELGNGQKYPSSLVPGDVVGMANAVQVDAGTVFSCALLDSGRVECWGSNQSGQLGNPAGSDSPTPVFVPNVSDAIQLSLRGKHACVLLRSGRIQCWGFNRTGQLGRQPSNRITKWPVGYVVNIKNATYVSSSIQYTYAVLADQSVKCWGANEFGQLGDGHLNFDNYVPGSVINASGRSLSKVAQISTGEDHACAVFTNGEIACWGANKYGQLGDGTTIDSDQAHIVPGMFNVAQVAAGDGFTCALLDSGSVSCWGQNDFGQLGNGTISQSLTPVFVKGISNAQYIIAGHVSACAVLPKGEVQCWGGGTEGELGNGKANNATTPTDTLPL